MATISQSAIGLLLLALCTGCLVQVASTEDLIWYNSAYGHRYAWQGTTDGKSAPELLIASVINQPWLVAISKTKNIIYWTEYKGIIGAWNVSSQHSSFVYQLNIGNWDESSKGPALTGLDLDELNNHLYFTFNRSIYRLDLSQTNPSPSLIASYNNLVFNPRFSASRNSLFFCIRNNYQEQGNRTNNTILINDLGPLPNEIWAGDLVQVSLSDPSTVTTLVHNTSTGSVVQQLFIDETVNTLYYNSPGTLTMRGVSLTAPYNEVFKSIYLSTNPTFFDFNPTTTTFIFSNLRFSSASTWSLGPNSPTAIYTPSYGRVTGVKFFNDTHALVTYQYSFSSTTKGSLNLVNMNNPNDTTVLLQNFGMGSSLIFDEKYCNFYYVENPHGTSTTDQRIIRKNIKEDKVSLYYNSVTYNYGGMGGITLDVNKRNLIVSSSLNGDNMRTISYFPLDKPDTPPVYIMDSKGRSIYGYTINDKTGDIFYASYEGFLYNIYRLDASAIQKDWIKNVGHLIIGGLWRVNSIVMTVDSVNNKLYLTNSSTVLQSNFDGSDLKVIYYLPNTYGVRSMRWDPSSNRLFLLDTPTRSGWIMASLNSDGSNLITVPLNASTGSGTELFSKISPDPNSDWVYMNAAYYSPLRIKKDGSIVEKLNSYVPFTSPLSSISFDETTGSLYYSDVQCTIKKINVTNINRDDPNATPFEVRQVCDSNEYSYFSFIHDRPNKMFWMVLTKRNQTVSTYTVSVTPVNGGPTKQLFNMPKNVQPQFAIDTTKGKMFAYTYTYDRWHQRQEQAIVMMDLYNGSNLRTVKKFDYPNYTSDSLTAMTFDPRTNQLYYALDSTANTKLESFDPVTFKTKRLWTSKKRLYVRDMKVRGTSVFMAMYYGNVSMYDMNNGNVTELDAVASALSLDPSSNNIYLGEGFLISGADVTNFVSTRATLLSTFNIENLVFDLDNRYAYLTLRSSRRQDRPPYYYRTDLDGRNKKRMQVENSFYVPNDFNNLSLFNGKFYTTQSSLNSFNIDGTNYQRIMQSIYVQGSVKYDDVSQRVYWQENYGQRFYSCAVYSGKFADCLGYYMFPELTYPSLPQLSDFALGNNNMVYFTAQYLQSIYQMDLNIGVPSLKVLVKDSRLTYVYAIATDKARSALFVTTTYYSSGTPQTVLRVEFDGTITTLYANATSPSGILVTDLTHCK